MHWNPERYLEFADQRLRPALDLLGRVPPVDAQEVVDLGCGTGNLAPYLLEHFPSARLTLVDSSPAMLERARQAQPSARHILSRVEDFRSDAPIDLIFSNATLHWVDDHQTLLPRLCGMLSQKGVLAVQMPNNFAAPSHTTIADAVRAGPWQAQLAPLLRTPPLLAKEEYFELLAPLSRRVDLWETEYLQVLHGEDPVFAWTSGTALLPFLSALPEPARGEFAECYRGLLRAHYPRRPDGHTLLPFRRLFLIAER